MPYTGLALDSRYAGPWILAVGKLILNFGVIEQLSFMWVDTLAQDEVLRDMALDMQFAKRVELIRRLLDRSRVPTDLDKRIREAWAAAEGLSKLRNDIAHSPAVFGWHGPGEGRPPDFIGSLNLRKLKGKMKPLVPLVELSYLGQGIDEVVKAAELLDGLLDEAMLVLGPNNGMRWTAFRRRT